MFLALFTAAWMWRKRHFFSSFRFARRTFLALAVPLIFLIRLYESGLHTTSRVPLVREDLAKIGRDLGARPNAGANFCPERSKLG